MRTTAAPAIVMVMLLVCGTARADDDKTVSRAILDQAMRAHGGEAVLAKFAGATMKLKGTVHVQNMALPFAGELATQGADQQRAFIEFEAGGQKFAVTNVFNRDKGWVKLADNVVAMTRDQLAEVKEETYASSLNWLVPLKDEAFTLAPLGEIQVDNRPALGIRISHKGHRDVNLYFDKQTHRLAKAESRVKDQESGQEVTQETFLSNYDEKGVVQRAHKMTVKRDGKLYVEAEIQDFKAVEKLDDSLFDKP